MTGQHRPDRDGAFSHHREPRPPPPAPPHADLLLRDKLGGTVAQAPNSASAGGSLCSSCRYIYQESPCYVLQLPFVYCCSFFWNKGLTAPFGGKTQ